MQTEKWKQLIGLGIVLAGAGNATFLLGQSTGHAATGLWAARAGRRLDHRRTVAAAARRLGKQRLCNSREHL